ncbi:uncharacterized protein LOC101901050 [Musca domestica]|uniref:Uncharacterized protein LOC101901050 n=1 Tax=Musca domestica TaxID=7370 RepID=A0A1I8N789_MUSDO|nr:uncharacterized protein LOC101901050 [Musca domestica]
MTVSLKTWKMKFILLILSLAALSQVSLAGVLGRFKRGNTAEGFEFTVNFLKNLAEATGPLVKSVVEQIPKTEAYSTYKAELDEYMTSYEEYKTKKGMCFQKSMTLLEKFITLTDKYEKEDAPAEAKKVDELFNSYDNQKLEKEIERFVEKMESMEKDSSEEDEMDGVRIVSKMLEIC